MVWSCVNQQSAETKS